MSSRKLVEVFTILSLVVFLLPQGAGATPSGCTEGAEVRSCCGTDRDPNREAHSGWRCGDTGSREGGDSGCAPGLCPGGAANMCCPPASGGGGGDGEDGAGSGGVRESLKTAASGAGLNTGRSISGIVATIIRTLLGFVGVIFLILIIFGGMMWMNAGGNEESVTKAKKLITNAVIGVIIIMAAYLLVSLVMSTVTG
jgi:hypothetical protein